MVYGLFSVYDEKAQVYLPPFVAKTTGEADRIFDSVIKDGSSTIAHYPSDHSLYKIADYDDSSAQIIPVTPIIISRGDSHA